MPIKFFLLFLLSLSTPSFAMEEVAGEEDINFCLDAQTTIDNDALAKKHPEDKRLIRLVALRTGLCDLLTKKIVELEFAIDLFNEMKTLSIRWQLRDQMLDNENDETKLIDI